MGPDDFTQWKAAELKSFLKGTVWRVGTNEKGVDYYYDKVKKKSQWVKPEEIAEFEASLTYELFLIHQEAVGQPVTSDDAELTGNSTAAAEVATVDGKVRATTPPAAATATVVAETAPMKQPVIEKVYTREELVAILDSKDCILEPHIVARCRQLIKEHKEPSTVIMDKLISNYSGYPMMAAAILEWIKYAKVLEVFQNNKNLVNGNSTDFPNTTAGASIGHYSSGDCNGEIIAPLLADLISQRFNRKLADSLVNANKGSNGANGVPEVPAFLHEMVQSPTFNTTLQDLYHDNQNSTLLKACCSGTYTVAHSEQEGQTVGGLGSAVRALTKAEVVRADVRRCAIIQDLMSKYTISSCKGDASQAADSKQQIVDLIARSSEAVKMTTLHVIAQQLRAINSRVCDPSAPANNWNRSEPAGESTSRKRLLNEGDTDDHPREAKSARSEAAYDHACTAALAAASTALDVAHTLADLQRSVVATASISTFTTEYSTAGADEQGPEEASWQVLAPAVDRNEISTAEMEKLVCLVQSTSFDAACLQHPSVQRLLADHLLLHSHNNDGGAGDTARLLAVSSSAGSENSAGCATAGEQSMEVSRLVDCASRVLSTAELCQSVAELFFGVIPSGAVDSLRTNVHSCSASAVYVTRWCYHSASDASHRANLTFLPVLKLLVSLVRTAVEAHPLCYCHGADACEAIFAASRNVLESAVFRSDQAAQESVMTLAATEVQKEVLDVLVALVSLGHVHTPMQYFISSICSYDADLARHLLHSLLASNISPVISAPTHAALFIDLFHSDSAQRAVRSQHFAAEDRALLHTALTTSVHPSGLELLPVKTQQRRGDLLQLLQRCIAR